MVRSVAPGRVLGGRYRLDAEIARGGMATVWRGEDPLLARSVAVKTLDPTLAEDEALRTRFRREAVAAAAVAHPNIVATYDTGEDDGLAYIVMELVEGATLRQAIDLHGALPPARSADIAAQVADALAAAHARGLVHRDVKPSNVLVQLDGRVKVTDFGIAKAADQNAEDLTRAGNVMGTARYLAPEQLEGGPVDERADVYSLGVVLYEMLTGSAPFGADTEIGTAVARLTTTAPPIDTVRAGVPAGLAHVVERALERAPEDRWPNAAAMRDALAPFRVAAPDRTADATMPVALPPRPSPGPVTAHPAIIDDGMGMGTRILIWLLAIVLGFGAGYVGYLLVDDDTSTPPATPTATLENLPVTEITAFDPPPGDGEENDANLDLALDGNATTNWATEGYFNATTSPKQGVGFVLQLRDAARIRALTFDSPLSGWSVDIYVADSPATTLAGWGDVRGAGDDLGTHAVVALSPAATGQYVLVWFTQLVREPDGRYRARISDVSVRGTATPDRQPDDVLVRAAATGDRDALDSLLTRHVDRLHAVCRRICGTDAAFDATQNALIAITRSIARFDGRAAFSTWTHRIAVNAALDELRRARRQAVPASDRLDEHDAATPAALGPERVVDRLDLDAALATLSDEFRTAVVLRDLADLDYAEIAAVLDVPIGTVRSRIARGRAALAAALGNRTATPDVQGIDHG